MYGSGGASSSGVCDSQVEAGNGARLSERFNRVEDELLSCEALSREILGCLIGDEPKVLEQKERAAGNGLVLHTDSIQKTCQEIRERLVKIRSLL